ncbi:28S ribosomal protein S11, mitochondrial [Manacus vitellinus]|uniref:28S ribosomal protein S11, mitochondrial n=1 Tax=Manacus vitellinus TaxID=328815 RepID=UPI00115E8274|nr:28S ribosomal protein S11, mitochondrial [Manacus vitellinus]
MPAMFPPRSRRAPRPPLRGARGRGRRHRARPGQRVLGRAGGERSWWDGLWGARARRGGSLGVSRYRYTRSPHLPSAGASPAVLSPFRARAIAALCRGLRTGPPRLQDIAGAAAKETEKQSATEQSPLILQRSSMRWDGKVYEEIPIAHIKATYNNTHVQVVSFDSRPLAHTSCGTEGFQNAKKGTAIAAQTAAMAAAVKARGKGVLHVRVVVKGLGPGRKAAIKGLTMGGLEVISITDNTPVPHNGCRPRKARRM